MVARECIPADCSPTLTLKKVDVWNSGKFFSTTRVARPGSVVQIRSTTVQPDDFATLSTVARAVLGSCFSV